jgi:hypothetical protein
MCGRVLECLRKAITAFTAGSLNAGRPVPPLSLFKYLLLEIFPLWRAEYI